MASEGVSLQQVCMDLVLEDAINLGVASANQVLLHLLQESDGDGRKFCVHLSLVMLKHLIHAMTELVSKACRPTSPDNVKPLSSQRRRNYVLECPLARQQSLVSQDGADNFAGHVEARPGVVVLEALRTASLPAFVLGQRKAPSTKRIVWALVALLESQHSTCHEQLMRKLNPKDAGCQLTTFHAAEVLVSCCAQFSIHCIPVLRNAFSN
mmetsp:Transcript_135134/g.328448  ORF Transcript_135134/g.328448 Transcript_135134/m.328448 type:complete len:210 (-) Transcript_135134:90-719(-)